MYIIRGVHERPDGPPMEAMKFNEIKPYMMYIFEPLRTCTMHFSASDI